MRRKRSFDDSYPAAASASSSASHTLDSPPHIPFDEAQEAALFDGEEPARKKLASGFDEQWLAAAALNFSGFDSLDQFGFLQSPVDLMLEDSMADLTEAQLDSFQPDGDCTPHSLASDDETPRMATTPPPFLHQAQEGADAAGDAHMQHDDAASGAQSSEIASMLQEAEDHMHRYQPPSPFSSALSKPMHTNSELPLPLKTAHLLTANPFRFEVFGATPQISPSFGAMDISPTLEPIKFSLSEPCGADASPQPPLLLPPSSAFSPPPALFDEATLNW